jgi:hypothetical protein
LQRAISVHRFGIYIIDEHHTVAHEDSVLNRDTGTDERVA